jgi:Na+/serine symporter
MRFLRHLYVQVLIGIIVGGAVGFLWPTFGAQLKPLGDAFVNLVKMLIAPIIFTTVVVEHRKPDWAPPPPVFLDAFESGQSTRP